MLRLLLLAATLTLSACATQAPGVSTTASRDCFRTMDVNGYSVLDQNRVAVRVGPRRSYALTVAMNTREFHLSQQIALRSTTSFVCVGDPIGVELYAGDLGLSHRIIAIERVQETEPQQPAS